MTPRHLILACWLATAAAAASAADPAPEELGRLFFTPERRAILDRQRALNIREARKPEDPTITVNGLVTRSSGPATAWINGSPEIANGSAGRALGNARNPNRVRVAPEGERARELAVGTTLHRATGDISSPLEGGHLTVNRAAAPAPRQP